MSIDAGWDITLPAEGITLYGDVDLNGKLDSADITKLSNYITGKASLNTQAKKNADFNGDGKINDTDVTLLKAYIESQSSKYIVPSLDPVESI